MQDKTRYWWAASALCLSMLSACGGGGDSSPGATTSVPAATASFALGAGYRTLISSAAADSFKVEGSCNGTATVETAAAMPAAFENVLGAVSVAQKSTILTDCSSEPGTGTTYYNANYVQIGLEIDGGEYAKFASPPTDIPASTKVGDTAALVTLTTYPNKATTVSNGRREVSFVIEAEPTSSNTAIFNLVTRSYDLNNTLLTTQQSRYRIAPDGTLTLLTIEVQFSFPRTGRLLYTKR